MTLTTGKDFMLKAISLAKKGLGGVNPNPLVGAVIVKDGKIIGEGFHKIYGDLHAERNAIKNCRETFGEKADELLRGSEIFVTLEPCCHTGKQPPCVEAILECGIKKVVIGSRDPNPLVSGKGAAILRGKGVEVVEDFLREECDELNPVFFHYITKKTPYVVLKYAMTADGKIATENGDSKWISCEESRKYVHFLRSKYSAILAGKNTVLKDNPTLDCRLTDEECEKYGIQKRNPVRIILDTKLEILKRKNSGENIGENIFKTADSQRTIFVCGENDDFSGETFGTEILRCRSAFDSGIEKVDVSDMLKKIGELKIDGILVEGGGEVHGSFIDSEAVNKAYAFIAPKILGGKGKSPVSGKGVDFVKDAANFEIKEVRQIGTDIVLELIVNSLGGH